VFNPPTSTRSIRPQNGYELNTQNPFEDPPAYTSAVPASTYTNPCTSVPLPTSNRSAAPASQQADTAATQLILDAEARKAARKARVQASTLGPRRREVWWRGLRCECKAAILGLAFFVVFVVVLVPVTTVIGRNSPAPDDRRSNATANATTTGL